MGELSEPRPATWPVALVIALLASTLLVWGIKAFAGDDEPAADKAPPANLAELKLSSTDTTVNGAPRDPAPEQPPTGTVVHPKKVVPLRVEPNGEAFAKLAPEHFGDAWFPVVERQTGWLRVLLPSRPNGSTGWVRVSQVQSRQTTSLVRVRVGSRQLELVEDGDVTGTWPVAVGAPDTPTPTGRTFILGQLVDSQQSYSPVILPLGTHSQTLDSYGGGPGTVALHGWTDTSVFGQAVSHGCVRVPADALERLRSLPLGTPVLIENT